MIITLGKSKFSFIQCYKAQFNLQIQNKVAVGCADCKERVSPGEAINRRQYRHNGYICFPCFASHMRISTIRFGGEDNDAGFIVNTFSQLQACSFAGRTYTTPEVVDAVLTSIQDRNPKFVYEPVRSIDQPITKSTAALVARMTIRKPGKPIVTVEVRSDVGQHNFYTWFSGNGRARKQTRITPRSYSQGPSYKFPVGLEVIAAKHFQNGEAVKITILKKKLYKKFCSCSGDQLPGYRPVIVRSILEPIAAWKRRGVGQAIPVRPSLLTKLTEITS